MIDLEEVEREIDKVEHTCDTTYRACERLAWLYIVRDHLKPGSAPKRTDVYGSDFLEACSMADYSRMMHAIDEHMQVIKTLYPKEYERVLDKIRAAKLE